jgi:mono/diheme cytochrome c family protein
MKKIVNSKFLTFALTLLFLGWVNLAFVASPDGGKPWSVPDAAKKVKNPTSKTDAEGLADGKALWAKHCKSCHGAKGLGDGPKSKELDTDCGDFSVKAVQSLSDGELYYKIKEGRDDMPSFKKKITDDEEIWHIVNFMRTMAK